MNGKSKSDVIILLWAVCMSPACNTRKGGSPGLILHVHADMHSDLGQ